MNYVQEIQNLIHEIQTYPMPNVEINPLIINQIEQKLTLLESIIYQKPIPINLYQINVIEINTKNQCCLCHRQAQYQMANAIGPNAMGQTTNGIGPNAMGQLTHAIGPNAMGQMILGQQNGINQQLYCWIHIQKIVN